MALIPSYNRIGITTLVVGGVASFFAVAAMASRVWARKLTGSPIDASDWTCFAGLIFALTLFGSTVNGVVQGLGLDIEDIKSERAVAFSKSLIVGQFTWTASNTLVRISMLILYIHLFPNRRFTIFCWIFLVENIACWVAIYIAVSVVCRPFAYNWDITIPGGHCGDRQRLHVWTGVQNLPHNAITIAMPMAFLWGLQLPWAKRVSLMLMFAMGSRICVLIMIRTIETAKKAALQNVTAEYAAVGILSILESLLGVVNVSLPLLRPAFLKIGELLGLYKGPRSAREPYLHSIGAQRIRAKTHDPFPLDTIVTMNAGSENKKDHSALDGESIEQLIEGVSGTTRA